MTERPPVRKPVRRDFARAMTAACGPREAKPLWCHDAQRMARQQHDDSALRAAIRKALEGAK